MRVRFVFTNPGHHLEAMRPVAERLGRQGHDVKLLSLAELRGFRTPQAADVHRVLPPFRRSPAHGRSLATRTQAGSPGPAHRLLDAVLRPRLRWLLRGSDVVVVPNDTAWPYDGITAALRRQGRPFVLMQEGIRFPLPGEQALGAAYGGGGAHALCVWGEASAEHFRTVAPAERIHVTGTPRFDAVQPADHAASAQALLERLGETRKPLLFLSNPVDDMGYCSTVQKMEAFAAFATATAPILADRDRALLVKLHPREDLEAFREVAMSVPDARIHVVDVLHALEDTPLVCWHCEFSHDD